MHAGSWNYAYMKECKLPSEVADVFEEAMDYIVDVTYVPVLYIGSQLVDGMNYSLICKSLTTTQPTIEGCKKLIIYKPLNDAAQVIDVEDII